MLHQWTAEGWVMLQELFYKLNGCFDTFFPRENLSSKEYIVDDCC